MATIMQSMVMIYANLVINKVRTIESLPQMYQGPVQEYIDSLKQKA